MPEHEKSIPLLVTAGNPGDESLYLRFPLGYRDEVLGLLDEGGISHGSVVEMSASTELAIEAVRVLGSVGGLGALVAVINAFVRRHRDRRVVLRDGGIQEIAGFSAKETQVFLELKSREQIEIDERWRAMLRQMNEDNEGR